MALPFASLLIIFSQIFYLTKLVSSFTFPNDYASLRILIEFWFSRIVQLIWRIFGTCLRELSCTIDSCALSMWSCYPKAHDEFCKILVFTSCTFVCFFIWTRISCSGSPSYPWAYCFPHAQFRAIFFSPSRSFTAWMTICSFLLRIVFDIIFMRNKCLRYWALLWNSARAWDWLVAHQIAWIFNQRQIRQILIDW